MLAAWPRVVTLGPSHSASLPPWLPVRPVEIPLSLAPPFDIPATPRPAPAPVAVFASNPLRGLDWLLDLWTARIRPALSAASA